MKSPNLRLWNQHNRISSLLYIGLSKQRRLSFEEYRSVYLPVPKIENRMPVFISASLRDELDKIARRLGGKRMSASGIVENMVRHHLITYGDELKEWYKL